jgi:UDP-N-acetylglucosamine 2-epimerase (non-hydrolysing)
MLPSRRMPDGRHALIHTGQHYDRLMSDILLEELGVPAPDHMLGVRSASHAVQTARVMERIEPVLEEEDPDLVIVPGDVNSTPAATLVAVKLGIPVAHLESGLRSFDRTMPEEINRIVADWFSEHLFLHSDLQGASPLCITRPRVEKGGRFGAHPRGPRGERCPRGRGVHAPPPSHM